jgi:MYXO-CTERM domain-containing protein
MSFSRISTLALAFAAGLAAPVSAATWKIDFFDPSDPNPLVAVGTATFTADVPTPSQSVTFGTNWTSTVRGVTYLGSDQTTTQLTLLGGQIVATFSISRDGGPVFDSGLVGSALEMADGAVMTFWQTFGCLAEPLPGEEGQEPKECFFEPTPKGTYTLTQLPGVDPEPPVIPLPATAALLPLGLMALGALRRRKSRG